MLTTVLRLLLAYLYCVQAESAKKSFKEHIKKSFELSYKKNRENEQKIDPIKLLPIYNVCFWKIKHADIPFLNIWQDVSE